MNWTTVNSFKYDYIEVSYMRRENKLNLQRKYDNDIRYIII